MSEALRIVRAYHQATKHHTHAFAPGPGFLDWESQPDPFRRYSGAALVPLPLVAGRGRCSYDALYELSTQAGQAPSLESLGLFLELALGLSAWKSIGTDRWALRNNPSSGNLHPTEGYLLLWRSAGPELQPGLYHYAPHEHALERRAVLPAAAATRLAGACPGRFGALGLTSIVWREEWKYGARAYRYCQHDVGHALAAARYAASVLGWRLVVDTTVGDEEVVGCLGLDRSPDLAGVEPEHPDLLAVLGEPRSSLVAPPWAQLARALTDWTGRANRLSPERVRWPQIAAVLPATRKPQTSPLPYLPPPAAGAWAATDMDASSLIRQRRSAQRMDGHTRMAGEAFERALARTLPADGCAPFDALPVAPALNLVLFVHAVEGLAPGLYALIRNAKRLESFRDACQAQGLEWAPVADTPLPLFRLQAPADVRRTAAELSCHQGIAGGGAFSLAMLADTGRVLGATGPWAYRHLHWEAGMVGQALYLESEAAGLRGTGIGCFFDDGVHRLLGLDTSADAPWQDLYHFTVGGPVEDLRLGTEPAYGHLPDRYHP